MEREDDLLVRFKQDQNDPEEKDDPPERFILDVSRKPAKQKGDKDHQSDRDEMKRTVVGGAFHLSL